MYVLVVGFLSGKTRVESRSVDRDLVGDGLRRICEFPIKVSDVLRNTRHTSA